MACPENIPASSLSFDLPNTPASIDTASPPPQELLQLQVGTVFDINNGLLLKTVKAMFVESVLLRSRGENRVLPTALFFDDVGLQIWSQITQSSTYHQTRDEIELLETYGEQIINHIAPDSTLMDIGAGDVHKVEPLLDALEACRKPVDYFAVDLSKEALERAMEYLVPKYRYVKCFGLWGTFDDAMGWSRSVTGPKCILSLGSFFGNDHFHSAVARLSSWRDIMSKDDRMLLGLDGRMDKTDLWNAYHDPLGLFDKFVRNGLAHSNEVLGCKWYCEEDWTITGVIRDEPLRHFFLIKALRTVVCDEIDLNFQAGDSLVCFEVFKYDSLIMLKQFAEAGFTQTASWKSPVAPNSFRKYLCSIFQSSSSI